MCPTVENPDLVLLEAGDSQGLSHSWPAECGSRQAIQARTDHPNRVNSPSRGLPVDMLQVAPTPNSPSCNKVQQVTSVHATSPRLPSLDIRCTQYTLGGSGLVCLPTSSHSGQGGGQTKGLPIAGESWLHRGWGWGGGGGGEGGPVLCLFNLPNLLSQPFNQIPHKNLWNLNLHAWL